MNSTALPQDLPPSPTSLADLAEKTNAALEESVNQATHQAFNLGCLIGLLPAAIFALAIFLVTGFSLIGALMAVVLGITGAIAFANLAAMITRRNTIRHKYNDEIGPDLNRTLAETGHTREEFDLAARTVLPPTAALAQFIQAPLSPAGIDIDENIEEETQS